MGYIHGGDFFCVRRCKKKRRGALCATASTQLLVGLFLLFGAFGGFGLLVLADLKALHEAINLTGSVEQALLTRIEWVAFRTNIKAQRFFGRYGWPSAPTTSTRIYCFVGFWMNSLLHRMLLTVRPRWRTR